MRHKKNEEKENLVSDDNPYTATSNDRVGNIGTNIVTKFNNLYHQESASSSSSYNNKAYENVDETSSTNNIIQAEGD